MSARRRSGNLVACPATCWSTTTSRTSAVSSSPPSGGTKAHFGNAPTLASCRSGGHAIWWTVEAATERGRTRAIARATSPSARPRRASARSRFHDRKPRPATPQTRERARPCRLAMAEVDYQRRTVMFRTDRSSRRNLAARIGRWSAAHWKTATFGWLALVLRRLRRRQPGRHEAGRSDQGRPRRVGPHGQDPRCRVQGARE